MRVCASSLGILAAALMAGSATIAHAESAGKGPFQIASLIPADDLAEEIGLELDSSVSLLAIDVGQHPTTTLAALANVAAPKTGITRQEAQSAIARAIKSGYSLSTEADQLPVEMSRGYAISDKLSAALRTGFSTPVGDEMTFTAAAAETRFALGQFAPAISWSWYTGVDMTLQSSGTNAVESGPQFRMGSAPLALTFTPKVAHSFGAHQGDDIAFAYAAGLKSELAKGIAIGIEAFGASADIATAPGTSLQSQRTSSGLYVGLDLTPQQKRDVGAFAIELGALADMSEAKPDWAGKVKATLTW